MGLVTVGVHTPEFPFGRDPINVRQAIERLGIRHCVVMDNNYIVWNAFRSTVWPTKYLVDKHGFIRYIHAGEGAYQNFEHAIQSLLSETGYHGDFPLIMDPIRETDRPGALSYRATPEILAGWQRGTLGNVEGYAPESTVQYADPQIYVGDRLYLSGIWHNDRSYLQLDEEEGREGYLTVSYQAKDVNAVIKPEGEKNFQVFVRQDNEYLTPRNKGDDVRIDEDGRSYILVTEPRLYSIVKNREFGEHVVRLSTRSRGFALYSLSFVSALMPEVIV
jgi:hypothetical protein